MASLIAIFPKFHLQVGMSRLFLQKLEIRRKSDSPHWWTNLRKVVPDAQKFPFLGRQPSYKLSQLKNCCVENFPTCYAITWRNRHHQRSPFWSYEHYPSNADIISVYVLHFYLKLLMVLMIMYITMNRRWIEITRVQKYSWSFQASVKLSN